MEGANVGASLPTGEMCTDLLAQNGMMLDGSMQSRKSARTLEDVQCDMQVATRMRDVDGSPLPSPPCTHCAILPATAESSA